MNRPDVAISGLFFLVSPGPGFVTLNEILNSGRDQGRPKKINNYLKNVKFRQKNEMLVKIEILLKNEIMLKNEILLKNKILLKTKFY